MTKLAIPVILAATIMVAGMFAFAPVDQASTVHTTIGVLNLATADGVSLLTGPVALLDLSAGTDIAMGQVCAVLIEAGGDESVEITATAAAGELVVVIAAGGATTTGCEPFASQLVEATDGGDAGDLVSYSIAWVQASP